jgi:hypothetical protein
MLEFHELLGNDHLGGPGAGKIDFEQCLEPSRAPCEDGYAGTEIDRLVNIMRDKRTVI